MLLYGLLYCYIVMGFGLICYGLRGYIGQGCYVKLLKDYDHGLRSSCMIVLDLDVSYEGLDIKELVTENSIILSFTFLCRD
ncbi:hypothetical protein Hdeb2414_s0002g00076911 [Helianthus debilis subsp. tardiflorus]